MKHSVMALGERHLEGEYKNVRAAGDLEIKNGRIKSLLCAGDIDIHDAQIGKIRAAGDVNAFNLTFGHCKAAGDITFRGICRGDTIAGIGSFQAELLECRLLRYGTNPKHIRKSDPSGWGWNGTFHAETFENLLPAKLSFDYHFKNIPSLAEITSGQEIQCTVLYALSGISAPSINAEEIFLLASGNVRVGEIAGTHITIDNLFRPNKSFSSLPKTQKYRKITECSSELAHAEAISGDTIRIKNTSAQSVSGIDVEIGELCTIEEVTYKNTIKISDRAVTGKVVKL